MVRLALSRSTMPKPSPEKRPPRMGEELNHTCHACGDIIPSDDGAMWRESDDKVWFMHRRHMPEVTDG